MTDESRDGLEGAADQQSTPAPPSLVSREDSEALDSAAPVQSALLGESTSQDSTRPQDLEVEARADAATSVPSVASADEKLVEGPSAQPGVELDSGPSESPDAAANPPNDTDTRESPGVLAKAVGKAAAESGLGAGPGARPESEPVERVNPETVERFDHEAGERLDSSALARLENESVERRESEPTGAASIGPNGEPSGSSETPTDALGPSPSILTDPSSLGSVSAQDSLVDVPVDGNVSTGGAEGDANNATEQPAGLASSKPGPAYPSASILRLDEGDKPLSLDKSANPVSERLMLAPMAIAPGGASSAEPLDSVKAVDPEDVALSPAAKSYGNDESDVAAAPDVKNDVPEDVVSAKSADSRDDLPDFTTGSQDLDPEMNSTDNREDLPDFSAGSQDLELDTNSTEEDSSNGTALADVRLEARADRNRKRKKGDNGEDEIKKPRGEQQGDSGDKGVKKNKKSDNVGETVTVASFDYSEEPRDDSTSRASKEDVFQYSYRNINKTFNGIWAIIALYLFGAGVHFHVELFRYMTRPRDPIEKILQS
ncbi:uncharacterized protein LOC114828063 [Galendromus occidentalis]|uniref:Uncharacterized protein LOC114828063 n=1 Tax=Galendromus occidentalis TaxID=34638 RepID=A0AAJ7SEQ7_9ACAR|nr:uncharacterized protein LOC114828063 [Galendromus occidentalis]